MYDSLRHVKLNTGRGYTLQTWDTQRTNNLGKSILRYEFRALPEDALVFEGEDFAVSPMHAIDSDAALLALLGFLTLRRGDTDPEYFEDYTLTQRDFCESYDCEVMAADVSIAEEVSGGTCVCPLWANLDNWDTNGGCSDRGTVETFQVIDHGEDGSQYFPGCGVAFTDFTSCDTGVGDTAKEALEDALESMAQNDAAPSKFQKYLMGLELRDPDKSARESLDHSECDEDHEGDDWSHWVSVRYTKRES